MGTIVTSRGVIVPDAFALLRFDTGKGDFADLLLSTTTGCQQCYFQPFESKQRVLTTGPDAGQPYIAGKDRQRLSLPCRIRGYRMFGAFKDPCARTNASGDVSPGVLQLKVVRSRVHSLKGSFCGEFSLIEAAGVGRPVWPVERDAARIVEDFEVFPCAHLELCVGDGSIGK